LRTHSSIDAVVRVDGLSKTYGRIRALEDVAFSIHAGEILGLIGPNGAGKTTLFNAWPAWRPPTEAMSFLAR
jgi:branched-chain amino acid transport system ATP-binding protein